MLNALYSESVSVSMLYISIFSFTRLHSMTHMQFDPMTPPSGHSRSYDVKCVFCLLSMIRHMYLLTPKGEGQILTPGYMVLWSSADQKGQYTHQSKRLDTLNRMMCESAFLWFRIMINCQSSLDQ